MPDRRATLVFGGWQAQTQKAIFAAPVERGRQSTWHSARVRLRGLLHRAHAIGGTMQLSVERNWSVVRCDERAWCILCKALHPKGHDLRCGIFHMMWNNGLARHTSPRGALCRSTRRKSTTTSGGCHGTHTGFCSLPSPSGVPCLEKKLHVIPHNHTRQHLPTSRPRQADREGQCIDFYVGRLMSCRGVWIHEDSYLCLGTDQSSSLHALVRPPLTLTRQLLKQHKVILRKATAGTITDCLRQGVRVCSADVPPKDPVTFGAALAGILAMYRKAPGRRGGRTVFEGLSQSERRGPVRSDVPLQSPGSSPHPHQSKACHLLSRLQLLCGPPSAGHPSH